ncbi:hypothetical protein DINM_006994 [Dirofilaria immitis]|nr:hypothetical protein [Dirofilaria immitis]
MESTSKLRILCLHGYQQNATIFREKSGSFRRPMKKYADFVFMNAPHEVESEPVSEIVDDSVSAADCRGWWYVSKRFYTRQVKDHEGFEESVQAVIDFARKEGPFDGILGFSQGATLAFLLSALKKMKPNLPCLHVFGETDKIVSHELSRKLVDLFDKNMVVVVEHPGGHMYTERNNHTMLILISNLRCSDISECVEGININAKNVDVWVII